MTGRAPIFAVAAVLSFASAAPRAGFAAGATRSTRVRKVALVPLFDTNRRFKPKRTFKLRFRASEKASGAPVRGEEISFLLRHGPGAAGTRLPARELKKGVFEVAFKPLGPGQYALVASIRDVPGASVPPIHLGVVGVADGLVEEPPDADLELIRHRGKSKATSR
jgi:hypothetical protein